LTFSSNIVVVLALSKGNEKANDIENELNHQVKEATSSTVVVFYWIAVAVWFG